MMRAPHLSLQSPAGSERQPFAFGKAHPGGKCRLSIMALGILGLATALSTPRTHAQANRTFDPYQVNQRFPDKTIFITPEDSDNTQAMKRVKLLNAARQHSMAQDVEKMVKLANELNSNTVDGVALTTAQRARKAEEIEKLARDVKEKMTLVFAPEPSTQTPLGAWPQ